MTALDDLWEIWDELRPPKTPHPLEPTAEPAGWFESHLGPEALQAALDRIGSDLVGPIHIEQRLERSYRSPVIFDGSRHGRDLRVPMPRRMFRMRAYLMSGEMATWEVLDELDFTGERLQLPHGFALELRAVHVIHEEDLYEERW